MKEQPKELLIDVSEYDPPQPFEEVIQLLLQLKAGEYIRMLHRKKPLPLLQFLQDNGFDFKITHDKSLSSELVLWEIIIWDKKDTLVSQYCSNKF